MSGPVIRLSLCRVELCGAAPGPCAAGCSVCHVMQGGAGMGRPGTGLGRCAARRQRSAVDTISVSQSDQSGSRTVESAESPHGGAERAGRAAGVFVVETVCEAGGDRRVLGRRC